MDHLKSNGSLADNFELLSSLADSDHNGRVDQGMINLIVLNFPPSLPPSKKHPNSIALDGLEFYMAIWKSIRFQIWMVCFSLGFSFNEIKHGLASSDKVDCCHFSSDGKLFVTGGRDKKVYSGSIQLLIMKWSLFSNIVKFSLFREIFVC